MQKPSDEELNQEATLLFRQFQLDPEKIDQKIANYWTGSRVPLGYKSGVIEEAQRLYHNSQIAPAILARGVRDFRERKGTSSHHTLTAAKTVDTFVHDADQEVKTMTAANTSEDWFANICAGIAGWLKGTSVQPPSL